MSARDRPPIRLRRGRWLYICLGCVCVGVGVAGALLPLLPGMPFFLVALWAFSRSSRRFHDWLYEHPRFGRRLKEWHEYRVVTPGVRLTAYVSMFASLGYTSYRAYSGQFPWIVPAALAAVVCVGVFVISRCPSSIPTSGTTNPGE